MFSEARCPGARGRCAAETQHVHVARLRPQQLWSAEEVRSGCYELPLLGSNQDSPDPESGVLPVTPRGSVFYGAEGARTPDLLGASHALSQLSYSPVRAGKLTIPNLFSKQLAQGRQPWHLIAQNLQSCRNRDREEHPRNSPDEPPEQYKDHHRERVQFEAVAREKWRGGVVLKHGDDQIEGRRGGAPAHPWGNRK